jgi:glutathione S-transferase
MPSLNDLTSWALSVARLGRGLKAVEAARPPGLLELYEFEACPYCRKVREVLSELDIEYICRPCARGSHNRAYVLERGGKEQFPFLLDDSAGVAIYESEAIIDHLWRSYLRPRPRAGRWLSPLNTAGSISAALFRPMRGGEVRGPGRRPEQLLVLYSFEASPYCRKVREALSELDIDHHVRNVAKGSARRPELVARGGKMMVPFLIDPNTDVAMYESDEIVAYLWSQYG